MMQQQGYHKYTIIKDIVVVMNKENHMMTVFLLTDGKLTIDQIKSFISQIELDHCIIFNDTIKKQRIHFILNMNCELFTVEELQDNSYIILFQNMYV